jgi:hypothetical protein
LLKIVHGTHCICAIGWIVQEEQEQHFIATLANERPMCSVLISKSNEFKSFACIEKFESGSGHVAHPPVALPLRASPVRHGTAGAAGLNFVQRGTCL